MFALCCRWFIATKFFPTKSRRAFPCWDEPAFKATFKLSIKHCSKYTAASSMPVRERIDADSGKTWTKFETTPNISTYNLGFVISDFTCSENPSKKLNVCANKKILPDMKFIQEVQDKALPFVNELAGIPEASWKLDSYAIPEADATMGNWGLTVYR